MTTVLTLYCKVIYIQLFSCIKLYSRLPKSVILSAVNDIYMPPPLLLDVLCKAKFEIIVWEFLNIISGTFTKEILLWAFSTQLINTRKNSWNDLGMVAYELSVVWNCQGMNHPFRWDALTNFQGSSCVTQEICYSEEELVSLIRHLTPSQFSAKKISCVCKKVFLTQIKY